APVARLLLGEVEFAETSSSRTRAGRAFARLSALRRGGLLARREAGRRPHFRRRRYRDCLRTDRSSHRGASNLRSGTPGPRCASSPTISPCATLRAEHVTFRDGV